MQAFVVSWSGQSDHSCAIATELLLAGLEVWIIHSRSESFGDEAIQGIRMIELEDSNFFGQKFNTILQCWNGEPILLVQADARAEDWGYVVERFRQAVSHGSIGVWAPSISSTPWRDNVVKIRELGGTDYTQVSQTDAIVIGFSADVIRRIAEFDFRDNNLGWGIDWAAITVAITQGLLVIRDRACLVFHTPGSGYSHEQAFVEQEKFLDQLSHAEKAVLVLLREHHELSRRPIVVARRIADFVVKNIIRLKSSIMLRRFIIPEKKPSNTSGLWLLPRNHNPRIFRPRK